MDTYTTAEAPLGPIKREDIWVFQPETATSGEGYFPWGEYYVDQYGNEYNSIEHVALCAVMEALK